MSGAWTDHPPRVPGAYWFHKNYPRPSTELVWVHQTPDGELHYRYACFEAIVRCDDTPLWFGPLTPPPLEKAR